MVFIIVVTQSVKLVFSWVKHFTLKEPTKPISHKKLDYKVSEDQVEQSINQIRKSRSISQNKSSKDIKIIKQGKDDKQNVSIVKMTNKTKKLSKNTRIQDEELPFNTRQRSLKNNQSQLKSEIKSTIAINMDESEKQCRNVD